MTSPFALLQRYKWAKLTEPERDAVRDCISIAQTRVAIGVGTVLTVTALIGQARRGRQPLPASLRYGAGGFFALLGAYGGFLSGGPLYAQRILSVPGSRLADDLRVVAGDWQYREPQFSISKEEFEAAQKARDDAKTTSPRSV